MHFMLFYPKSCSQDKTLNALFRLMDNIQKQNIILDLDLFIILLLANRIGSIFITGKSVDNLVLCSARVTQDNVYSNKR